MKNIKVVVVDVGAFNFGPLDVFIPPTEVYKAMEGWSSAEKLTYGPSFASLSHEVAELPSKSRWGSTFGDAHSYGVPRKPTHVSVFVDNIVGTVSGGQFGPSIFGVGLGIGRLRNWLRGESSPSELVHLQIASFLPPLLLDTLINIPHFLISVRNRLLPVQPFVRHPPPLPPVERAQPPPAAAQSEEEESGNDLSGRVPRRTSRAIPVTVVVWGPGSTSRTISTWVPRERESHPSPYPHYISPNSFTTTLKLSPAVTQLY
ncbi:hypothetical protein B0H14DRAFT_3543415 [Mycena olivaceomarginata]|nr:hypothetical protein B0H14DRAFT_3543415 [Mycena olivaceomarginata]